ncbi:hypothetical protein [Streptomyces griseorubiginosus]|uniref:hypothetical protein n=1 Tax=Streptomyces griseorubiginosus TaxID=67304 RepID=UPI0036EB7F33
MSFGAISRAPRDRRDGGLRPRPVRPDPAGSALGDTSTHGPDATFPAVLALAATPAVPAGVPVLVALVGPVLHGRVVIVVLGAAVATAVLRAVGVG